MGSVSVALLAGLTVACGGPGEEAQGAPTEDTSDAITVSAPAALASFGDFLDNYDGNCHGANYVSAIVYGNNQTKLYDLAFEDHTRRCSSWIRSPITGATVCNVMSDDLTGRSGSVTTSALGTRFWLGGKNYTVISGTSVTVRNDLTQGTGYAYFWVKDDAGIAYAIELYDDQLC